MKKYWKYMIAAAAVAFMAPTFTGCSDNDEVDPYSINYVYFRQPNDTYADVEYKFNGDFLSGLTDPYQLVPVRLTKPAPCDMTIQVAIDPSLVQEYNEANETEYVFLDGAEVLNPTLTVKKGEYLTDVITLGFTDHSGFFDKTQDLILPVVVKSANGGAVISKSSRIFLTFTSKYRANLLSITSNRAINVDIEEDGWQTAYTNYTFTRFLYSEWPVDAPVVVDLAVDNSLVASYNAANGTDYKTISATLSATRLELAEGEESADLSVRLGDYTGVENEEEYLIPVKLNLVSGDGALLPEADNVVYIEVSGLPKTVSGLSYLLDGVTQFTATDWDGTTWDEWDETDISIKEVMDQEVNYFWFYTGGTTNIDLGSVQTIAQIGMKFYAWYYGFANIENVETSTDGQSWTQWGNTDLPQVNSAQVYVTFSKPAKMRYIRFVNGNDTYDYGIAMKHITFWQ